jgi:GNAT superfamily N-acetyltransferase
MTNAMGAPSVAMLEDIRRFAEEPNGEVPEPWLPGRRIIRPDYVLDLSPSSENSTVSRVRTTTDRLDVTIGEVRKALRDNGFTGCAWFVGPSARPVGLKEHLLKRGFVSSDRPPHEPRFTAMVLTGPPRTPAPGSGIEARRVRDRDEYSQAFRAALRVHGVSEKVIDQWVDACLVGWDHPSGVARMTNIAFADGVLAGVGLATYGPSAHFLAGAAVLPAFRGRGVYRALLASRWSDAVVSGKPALAVQAGEMSRPILKRCGFEEGCTVDVLLDLSLA